MYGDENIELFDRNKELEVLLDEYEKWLKKILRNMS